MRMIKRLIAYYDGKIVDVNAFCGDRMPDPKRRFSLACMRVTDNARSGYVLEGDKLYAVSQSARKAVLIHGEIRDRVLTEIDALYLDKLYADACKLWDAGDHQGVNDLIAANVDSLKIKINVEEMRNTPTTEAAQLGLRMLADYSGNTPACAASMGITCVAHACGRPGREPCDANEEASS